MRITKKTFQFGQHSVTLETGRIARQATSAVWVSMGDTTILVTLVAKKEADPGRDFLPLTVNYQEKAYAAGKIPGGYFKREAKPSERETLISRLLDRPIRPLFLKGFNNEVQIIATVHALDPEVQTDIPAILGASAVLALSGIPLTGTIAAARVGFKDGHYLLNPSDADVKDSRLDLVVAGTRDAVLMVESEANQLTEDEMLGAVLFGHEQMQIAIAAIEEMAQEVGVRSWDWQPSHRDDELHQRMVELAQKNIQEAYRICDKMERQNRLAAIEMELMNQFAAATAEPVVGQSPVTADVINRIFHELCSEVVRTQILSGEPRIDGRDTLTVRPITVEVGVLPRVHGSALFTRGETQALVVTTLGTERDAQMIDDISGDKRDTYMLHYNFPPYCVGEVGFATGPKRREIGHGKLAKRAIMAVLPDAVVFPYTIRSVAEITESNGSSSMATVCGTSLALMDAGVPVKEAVAGVAMGLIKEGNRFAILTDIIGDEDHLGDMDFKVAGTKNGITALQMDIKIAGITKEIMERALAQAREARLHILNKMQEVIQMPRHTVSRHAPRIITMQINPEKISEVIGKGGATIRDITESTRTTIDIADTGYIKIAAVSSDDGEAAKRRIEELTTDVEVGKVYEGPVVKLTDFGAFVSILPGRQGLVHISQISNERVEDIRDYLREGQVVRVKVTDIDRQGRVRLSMKEVEVSS